MSRLYLRLGVVTTLLLVLLLPLVIGVAAGTARAGREIAYVRGSLRSAEIIHRDLDRGTSHNLTRTNTLSEIHPAWSADGDWLAYEVAEGRSPRWVALQALSGGGAIALPDQNPWNEFPAWSPTAPELAFVSLDALLHREIYHVDVPCLLAQDCEQTVRNLTRAERGDYDLSWSPDGEQIVFASWRSGSSQLYIADLRAGAVRRLTGGGANDLNPAWSPDGEQIAFVSDRGRAVEIYRIPAAGGRTIQLTDSPGLDDEPVWSPDGSRIAFVSERGYNRDLYLMDIDGGSVQRLTDHPAWDYNPRWSPDGSQIAFVSNRDAGEQIYLLDVGSGATQRLTPADDEITWAPAWRPR